MSIDEVLEAARARLERLQPDQAYAEQQHGALLIDTRSAAQRSEGGDIPGAIVVERTVLEWRLDPASPFKLPEATSFDRRFIVVCAHGYSSSLAAASLQDFEAWTAAGLPTVTTRG